MILEDYFIRYCEQHYKISSIALEKLNTGHCYLCNKEFANPKHVYLDHDKLRNRNGLCCRNCLNIRKEIYDKEYEELHTYIRNLIEPEIKEIGDIEASLKRSDILDSIISMCTEKGFKIGQVKKHIILTKLVIY